MGERSPLGGVIPRARRAARACVGRPASPSRSVVSKAFRHRSCQRKADQPEEGGGIRRKV